MELDDLFTPIRFRCGAVAPGRICLAPLTNLQSDDGDGTLSADEQRWLERRAEGGFAIVETCAAHVSEDGKGFDGQLGVWGDHQLPRLAELATGLSQRGALGIVQLYHGGVRAPSRLTGRQPWSASAFHEDRPGFEAPRAASEADIAGAIEAFVAGAVRSHRAGFAGVELHAAHGYLLSQFLSRTMNLRDDAWGGEIDGRARLVRTIAQRIRAAVPASFVLGARISPEDFGYARGLDLDESLQVARWLAEDGCDFVHLSLWDATRNTLKRPGEHAVPLFRAALPPEVKIIVAGGVWTPAEALAPIVRGADMVALGKAGILNPDWPKLAREPGFSPERGPLTPAELRARAIGERFVTYLRRFKGMVADA